MQKSIQLEVDVGHLQAELFKFCRKMADAFRFPERLADEVPRLRAGACAYQHRPTLTELKFMLVCNVLLDLALHGRSVHADRWRLRQLGRTAYGRDI